MRVLLAPDKFKGTLSAHAVADAIASVLRARGLDVDEAPMADGGDGTLDAFLRAGWVRHWVDLLDARGRPRRASIALCGGRALVELAEACGLASVLDLPLDPWTATSRGLGQAVRAALDLGASDITLALGGSASIDGGIGLLAELGFVVSGADGNPVTPDLNGVLRAARVSCGPPLPGPPLPSRWRVLADVTNGLVGRDGALAFAAQKGLPADAFDAVDAGLRRWAVALSGVHGIDVAHRPGAGAAGGVGAAAMAVLGAETRSGAHEVAAMLGLEARIAASDLVITGEGRFDVTSRLGKAPGVVVELARRQGVPVHVIAGQVADDADLTGISGVCTATGADAARALVDATESWAERLRSQ